MLSLLNDGDEEKAVDLLFELRLKHDLSLYLRAWANLMLGRLLPHKAKAYHQEAIDLIEEMKACGITEACQSDVRELAVEEQALLRDIKSRSEESSEYDEIEGAAADNDEDGESIDLATLSLLDVPVEGPANIEGVFGKVSAKADSGGTCHLPWSNAVRCCLGWTGTDSKQIFWMLWNQRARR